MLTSIRQIMRHSFSMTIFTIVIVGFLCNTTIKANTDYYFQLITIEKGLSQSTVNCILIDHKGLMWIGTSSGLNSFDRHEIKSYFQDPSNPNSLPGNRIFFIAEDSLHNLWAGTNNGLAKYDKEKDSFSPVIKNKPFFSYSFTPGGIIFGGYNTFHQYKYQTQTITELPTIGDTSIKNFHRIVYWKENIWLISDRGGSIWSYNSTNHLIEKVSFCQKSGIASLFVDSKQNVYVSPYRQGVICYSAEGKEKWHLTSSNSTLTNDIVLDIQEKDGKLWIATDGGGINILDEDMDISSLVHIPGDINSMPVNSITCLYKDDESNIWAGSVRGGIIGVQEVFIKTYKDVALGSTYGLSEKTVISLFEDKDGILWIGTDGGGINRYNPFENTFQHYPNTYNEKIVSITDYSDTELLLCLYGKEPYLFNKKTGSRRPFIIMNSEINQKIYQSLYITYANRVSKNKIYILSNYAYIYDTEKNTFSSFKTDLDYLGGLVLIGFTDDAAYLINNNELFEVQHKNDSLQAIFSINKNETIKAACRDKNGKFWLGTDNGLSCYDSKTGVYQKIETQLFYNVSTLLLDDENRLWIGAQNMLFSYHTEKNKFTIWGESDGFQPNELPFAYPPTSIAGNIYFGGVYGLVKINKKISIEDEHPLKLELMDVLVDGSSLSPKLLETQKEIKIPWNHSSVVIKVISKEKDVFRKRIFQYNIVGPNSSYTESYSHALTLSTLIPGDYSIRVSCNTKNGDWSPSQELLRITVTPPWYRNTWVITGLLLLIVCVTFTIIRNIIRRKELKLSLQIKEHKEKASEERIHFLINISHELRTPLTLICAPLKRLLDAKKQPESEVMTQQLTSVYNQACQMKNLINMVLDINKIKEDKNILRKKPYLLNEWIKSVCEDFRNEFEAKQITLVYHLDDTIDTLSFDKAKCEIVLSNLLMNALKFTFPNTQVTVATKTIRENIRITVSDQGIGLSNVDTHKLFTPFYQGNHDQHGSGIGLSYAKALIEMHRGKIGAYNNEDKGATFYFELPLHAEQEEKTDTSILLYDNGNNITIPEETIMTQISTENYTVLIVEDKQELRTFLKNELWGFKAIYTAEDGINAMEVIQNKQPDIIVSDIMMPRMDGYELCKNIKQNIHTSHIPVILLTARGDSDSTQIGYNLGADAYISKPFELDLLITVIRNQLKNREIIKQKYMDISYVAELRPNQPNNIDEEFLLKLSKVINDNLNDSKLDIAFLTDQMAMSRTSLYNKIKALTGIGANDYINRIRIEKAVQLLTHSQLSITEISDEVGFAYQRYFSTTFKQIKGVTPTQFRENLKRQE
ncbi:two-component regulator propeller domain-containing protein [uncultured Parabacteroides sp.]|uniref:hybrid sensor histidine kinase/response regulator transcription factor n=1 Tax=uncultured Parabacteroides sp. TaxID=512312 RepID=UPI0034474F8A